MVRAASLLCSVWALGEPLMAEGHRTYTALLCR